MAGIIFLFLKQINHSIFGKNGRIFNFMIFNSFWKCSKFNLLKLNTKQVKYSVHYTLRTFYKQ